MPIAKVLPLSLSRSPALPLPRSLALSLPRSLAPCLYGSVADAFACNRRMPRSQRS
jgi:hypothetical protein